MKRPMSDSLRMQKEKVRLVRFLGAAVSAVPRPAAQEETVLLEGGERGTISIQSATLGALVREGVVRAIDGRLVLSSEGKALVQRMRAGEEPFRAQHAEIGTRNITLPTGEQTVRMNLSESPLAQLARRRTRDGSPFLDDHEIEAGERLRADYTRAQIMPRVGANWSEAVASGRRGGHENGIAELTDAALSARQRVDKALTAVGPELAGILVDVCCFLKGLEQVEAERGWPVRSAKIVLKTALAVLFRHYEPRMGTRRRSIVHWGTEDYRPSVG